MIDTFALSLLVGINILYTIWAEHERSQQKTPLSSVEWHMFKERDFDNILKELKKLINENHNDTRDTVRDSNRRLKEQLTKHIEELFGDKSDTDKNNSTDEEKDD